MFVCWFAIWISCWIERKVEGRIVIGGAFGDAGWAAWLCLLELMAEEWDGIRRRLFLVFLFGLRERKSGGWRLLFWQVYWIRGKGWGSGLR